MNLPLNQEQIMIREMIRGFARSEIEPVSQEYNIKGEYPEAIIKKLGGLGLFGMMVPECYGGSDAGAVSYCLALQEIAYSCASIAVTLSVTNLTSEPILNFGSEEQKRRFLIPMSSGEYIGSFALTEPGVGSDPSGINTSAVKSGDKYILNGSKQFITNGSYAGLFLMIARTSPGRNGLSAFILPKGTKGLKIGKEENKMGLKIALNALDSGRIGIASQAVGMIRACFDEAVDYAMGRIQFGKVIIKHQSIQNMIADILVDYEASSLLTWNAASLKDKKKSFSKEASIAKLFSTESLNRCAYKALQIFGGYGYTKEYKIERIYRDARVTTIYEGTSEIQRIVISREAEKIVHN